MPVTEKLHFFKLFFYGWHGFCWHGSCSYARIRSLIKLKGSMKTENFWQIRKPAPIDFYDPFDPKIIKLNKEAQESLLISQYLKRKEETRKIVDSLEQALIESKALESGSPL